MQTTSKKQPDLLDIVFARRNKQYGAYVLRRTYPSNVGKAMLFTFLLMAAFIVLTAFVRQNTDEAADRGQKGKNPNGRATKIIEVAMPIKPKFPVVKIPPKSAEIPLKVVKDELVVEQPKPVQRTEAPMPSETGVAGVGEGADSGAVGEGNGTEGGGEPVAVLPVEPPQPKPAPEPPPKPATDNEVVFFAEEAPEFIGGQAAMLKYIRDNIRFPIMARENGIEGKVFVQFVVEKDGSISQIEVVRGIGAGCDEEAIKAIKSMPAWKPGKQNGKPVRVRFTLPVLFKLE